MWDVQQIYIVRSLDAAREQNLIKIDIVGPPNFELQKNIQKSPAMKSQFTHKQNLIAIPQQKTHYQTSEGKDIFFLNTLSFTL